MVVDYSDSLEMTDSLNLVTVEDIIYFGANINNTRSCIKEIQIRVGMAKCAMARPQTMRTDRNIACKTKMILVVAFTLPSIGIAQ